MQKVDYAFKLLYNGSETLSRYWNIKNSTCPGGAKPVGNRVPRCYHLCCYTSDYVTYVYRLVIYFSFYTMNGLSIISKALWSPIKCSLPFEYYSKDVVFHRAVSPNHIINKEQQDNNNCIISHSVFPTAGKGMYDTWPFSEITVLWKIVCRLLTGVV